jgi:hypothetical protein
MRSSNRLSMRSISSPSFLHIEWMFDTDSGTKIINTRGLALARQRGSARMQGIGIVLPHNHGKTATLADWLGDLAV